MPDWNQLMTEVAQENQKNGSIYDMTRRRYLANLSKKTGRNAIVYYSGWLQKPGLPPYLVGISDEDKQGFMTAIHGLDLTKGLDLILHTPGGDTAATESLVDYLKTMFDGDIRAVIPQIAMSGGTMIACACKKILMGNHSSLGPVDPQLMGVPAHGVVEEFETARREILTNPGLIPVWQPIIAKYNPTFVGECQKAVKWSGELVTNWLKTGMFRDDAMADQKINVISEELTNHSLTLSHARHLSAKRCRELGLVVEMLEDDAELQEAVLSVHHACTLSLSFTGAVKIIENQNGVSFMKALQTAIQVAPQGIPGGPGVGIQAGPEAPVVPGGQKVSEPPKANGNPLPAKIAAKKKLRKKKSK